MSNTTNEPLSRSWMNQPIGDLPIPWALLQHAACAEGQIRLLHQMGLLAEEEFKIAVWKSRLIGADVDPDVAQALSVVPELVENNATFPLSAVAQMHKTADAPVCSTLPVTTLLAVTDLSWLFLQSSVREYLQNVSRQVKSMVLVYVECNCTHLERYSLAILSKETNAHLIKRKAAAIYSHCKTVRSMLDDAENEEWHNIWLAFRYTNGLPMLTTEGRKRTWLELDAVMSAKTPKEARDKIAQLPMPEHMFIE